MSNGERLKVKLEVPLVKVTGCTEDLLLIGTVVVWAWNAEIINDGKEDLCFSGGQYQVRSGPYRGILFKLNAEEAKEHLKKM